MSDTSAAVGFAGFWGSLAILLGVAATWLQRHTTARWKAEDAKQERAAELAKQAETARLQFAPVTSAETELSAKRIELSRALLVIEEQNTHLQRQRRSLDELEREVQARSAALLQERARSESLAGELAALRRQIEGASHGPTTDRVRRDGNPDGYRGAVRPVDGRRVVVREEDRKGPQTPR